jgi:hypothetical protein
MLADITLRIMQCESYVLIEQKAKHGANIVPFVHIWLDLQLPAILKYFHG